MSSTPHCLLLASAIFTLLSPGCLQESCQPQKDISLLKKTLLCNYDNSTRPVLSVTESIHASFRLSITFIDFIEEEQLLKLFTWATIDWKDAYLRWEPQQHNSIEELPIAGDAIWTPDLSLMEAGGSWSKSLSPLPCWVYYNGDVTCEVPAVLQAHCSPDLSRWPLDEHSCTVSVGSSTYSSSSLNLTLSDEKIDREYLKPSKMWELLSSAARRSEKTVPSVGEFCSLDYSFTLRRRSRAHLATVGVPAIVVSVMTLLTLFLDPDCPERITLGSTSALANCLFLQYLGTMLPPSGDAVPAIVLFFRDSLFLAGSSLVLAVFLRGVSQVQLGAPDWLKTIVGAVLNTCSGRVLLFPQFSRMNVLTDTANAVENASVQDDYRRGNNDGGASSSPSNEDKETWQLAALLLDRITVVVFCIAFFVLLVRYIP